MEILRDLLSGSVILPLFLAIALGYAVGKMRIGPFSLGGLGGTLFAAILIGLVGVEVDENIKHIAFALFIYSLGYVSGPQFFDSLGRKTLGQVHLAVFSCFVIFATIWTLAQIFDLDRGTAAGLLAGATTESASIGTAGEAISNLDLDQDQIDRLKNNIAVTYAVTYLFGLMLVVTFSSKIAPRLMGVKSLSDAARELEKEKGTPQKLERGQFQFIRDIVGRMYVVDPDIGTGLSIKDLKSRFARAVTIQAVVRSGEMLEVKNDLKVDAGDVVTLIGVPSAVVAAGKMLGPESTGSRNTSGLIGEVRDIVVTRKDRVGKTVEVLHDEIDPDLKQGAYAIGLTRLNQDIPLYPRTEIQRGDQVRLVGLPDSVDRAAEELGYQIEPSDVVDYLYLALGIIAGILVGTISINIAGSPVSLGIGGGCLISGLVFGWFQSRYRSIGNLPPATALHLRDFGLAVFIASVGLAAGPQAWEVLQERGVLLPFLSILVVLVPMVSSMLYARWVVGMDPVLVTGALAGLLTCTAGLNAAVGEADSELPVLGYTIPYAIANVLLTLLGPVIVLTV